MTDSKQIFFLLLIAALFVSIVAFTCGIYFEGGSDCYAYHVIRGNFTSSPVPYFSSFGFYAFSSNVISALYDTFPKIPWFDLVVFLNITLGTFLLLLVWRIVRFPTTLFFVFSLVWMDNIILPELTKQGFWIAFLSLCIYVVAPCHRKVLRYSMIILFAYAFMIRAEPVFLALLCFILFQSARVLWLENKRPFPVHSTLAPFSLIAIIAYVLLNINFAKQDFFYQSLRPYQFTLWDFKQDPSTIQLANSSDSMILMAAEKNFISDSSKINKAFFHKIGLRAKDKTISAIPEYFERPSFLIQKVISELSSAKYYLSAILLFGLVFLASLCFSSTLERKNKMVSASIFILCLGLFTGICVFMKLERHVVLPLFMGSTLFSLLILPVKHLTRPWGFCLIAICTFPLLANIFSEYSFQKSKSNTALELSRDLHHRFPSSLTFIDLYTMVTLHGQLFENEPYPYSHSLSFDNAIIFYYPEWKQKMEQLHQPYTMEKLGDKFVHDSQKTIFIFSKGREHLFENYFLKVYGEKVVFKEVNSIFSTNAKYPFSYFSISSSGDQ